MTTYSADAAHTLNSQDSYMTHSANSRLSGGKARRKRAFGYVRVSTDMQAQYGLSLDAQKDQIAAYARAEGMWQNCSDRFAEAS